MSRSRTRLSRRALGLGFLGLPLAALATGATARGSRRLLCVHAEGGWDPLAAFAPLFDAPLVQMEAGTAPLSIGDFRLVDGPGRPAVASFFRAWGSRTVLWNGLSTRSVNHEVCQAVALTGSPSDGASDWGTLLGLAAEQSYALPHLVLSGPIFPGGHTTTVAHARGRVQEAVQGTLAELSDPPLAAPSDVAASIVDAHLEARIAAEVGRRGDASLAPMFEIAEARSRELVAVRDRVSFPPAEGVRDQADVALRALADGLCRVATIGTDFIWDTHGDNTPQAGLFDDLFSDLDYIMGRLEALSTSDGVALAESTDVLVVSEMGRTPAYNGTGGRDHWPFTSALLIGTGVRGGRTIGGFTNTFGGIGVDPASGEADPARPGIDARVLGATLLALGGVDPTEHIRDAEIVEGVLA